MPPGAACLLSSAEVLVAPGVTVMPDDVPLTIATADERLAIPQSDDEGSPAEEPPTRDVDNGSEKRMRPATVRERILGQIQRDPEAISWSQSQWAEYLDCARSAVAQSPAWKTVMAARAVEQARRRHN